MEIFLPIFDALDKAGVRYLVVGGVATNLYGYARLTSDIDLILHLERENCLAGLNVLKELDFVPRAPVNPADFADSSKRDEWVESKGLMVFSFYRTKGVPLEIDLFVREPMDFEDLWSKKSEFVVRGVKIQAIDKASLIFLKEAAGRPRDVEDVQALKETVNE